MADFGIAENFAAERRTEPMPVPDEIDFEEMMVRYNRRICLSGKLDRLERRQIVGDVGHA